MTDPMYSTYWPFMVLLIGIISVVVFISVLKIHPFISLILSSVVVGLISVNLPGAAGQHPLVTAVELPMLEFGSVAGKIAWVIALAAIIGAAMMDSGAAERIVQWLLGTFGEKRAAFALLLSGFILSIPVFFDTVFFLLIPLAIALAQKTKQHYLLYVLAMAGGAAITHHMVPPTPGPLIMAENLQLDLGLTIIAGLVSGVLPCLVVLYVAKRLDKKLNIPVRVVAESSASTDLPAPSLPMSLAPIVLPIVLISLASVVQTVGGEGLPGWLAFLGNKNVAMGIGAALAMLLWAKQRNLDNAKLWEGIAEPLQIAGVIILITAAGGAFGAMIKHSGIGDAIEAATANFHIHYVVLAWLIAAVMKTAQGSGTVSMITSSSIMFALVGDGSNLPYHPIYILLAVGFGAAFISWMNDSGFWVVSKMSGLTEKEALQTWTFTLACIAVVGLVQVLLFSYLLPLK